MPHTKKEAENKSNLTTTRIRHCDDDIVNNVINTLYNDKTSIKQNQVKVSSNQVHAFELMMNETQKETFRECLVKLKLIKGTRQNDYSESMKIVSSKFEPIFVQALKGIKLPNGEPLVRFKQVGSKLVPFTFDENNDEREIGLIFTNLTKRENNKINKKIAEKEAKK